ncbi:MAG: extracellular solute-binding protein [Bacilli bacterium]|nr:extracellular solute-binding protein [Bacilli bacterium]
MRKFTFILLFILCLFGVSACDDTSEGEQDYWDADNNGIPDWMEKKITLTYASWQHTDLEMVTLESLMIDAFMEEYPNITVEMISVGEDWEWEEKIIALAEAHTPENPTFPDVQLIRRLETMLPYNFLADISKMYDNDPDTDFIFKNLQNSGVYKEGRYAIPSYVYPQFWIINKDLLNAQGIPIPSYDWSWEQMESIAKAVNNETTHVVGLYGIQDVYKYESGATAYVMELPKVLKMKTSPETAASWGAMGFDGTKFNFLDDTYLQAMNKLKTALDEGWCKLGLDEETKLSYYGDESYEMTKQGKVAIWRQESWAFKNYMKTLEYDWDIYPGPSGVTGGNTDILGVSSLCQNKQAAYQLVKWMSFSEEGILTRFRLFNEAGNEVFQQANNYPYPIVDYGIDNNGVNKIWSSIPYGTTAPGLVSPEFLEGLRNGAFLLNKESIGFGAAKYSIDEYLKMIYLGETTFAALRETIQNDAMIELERAKKAVDELLSS